MARCWCSLCGRGFTALYGFDKHHVRRYGQRPPIVCVDPASVGLELKPNGCWGAPASVAGTTLRAVQREAEVIARGGGFVASVTLRKRLQGHAAPDLRERDG